MNNDWKEKFDGYVFEWIMPNRWYQRIQKFMRKIFK